MPVFINEVSAEIPQAPIAETQSQAPQEQTPVTQPEYEFMQNLNLIKERQQRLEFD